MERPERPVIGFLTDFGPESAPAICRGVMLSISRDAQIVDISHDVRKFAIRDGAYLLWTALPWLPVGVHLAVVDPGVGTERRPVAIRVGRGDVLVGPDNGVLRPAAAALGGIEAVRLLENPALMMPRASATFHGRDVFAPVTAHLSVGRPFEDVGPAIDPSSLVSLELPTPVVRAGVLETRVLFIDSFGNVRLAGTPADLASAIGSLVPGRRLSVELGADDDRGGEPSETTIPWARTFGDQPAGALLVYENSFGGLAIAVNQGSAAAGLGVDADRPVRLRAVDTAGPR